MPTTTKLVGGAPNQVPRNKDLSILAYKNFVSSSDVLGGIPTVVEYGAVGDNSTLNDSAFQKMEASSIQAFYLPEGTFKFGSTNILQKRYWGPGVLRFSDDFLQKGEFFSDELPRNFTGNRTITSPTDIVLAPNGNVQFADKRILNVGDPFGPKDGVNLQYAESNFASYSKGTFTPTVRGTTGAGTATYSLQAGTWYKIGDLVTVRVRLSWSNHTGTGAYAIPWTLFPPGNGGASAPGNIVLSGDWTGASGAGTLFCYITNGFIYPAKDYQNGANDAFVALQANGSLDLIITYET